MTEFQQACEINQEVDSSNRAMYIEMNEVLFSKCSRLSTEQGVLRIKSERNDRLSTNQIMGSFIGCENFACQRKKRVLHTFFDFKPS